MALTAVGVSMLMGRLVNEMNQVLPKVLFEATARALASVPVQAVTRQLLCAPCVATRVNWDARYGDVVRAAEAQMQAAAAALPEEQRGQLNVVMFLPPALQPSGDPEKPNPEAIPDVRLGVIQVAGTIFCEVHVPQDLPVPGRRPFLVAQGSLSSALAAMQG